LNFWLRSWRRPPPAASVRHTSTQLSKEQGVKGLKPLSEWPKVADAVIKAEFLTPNFWILPQKSNFATEPPIVPPLGAHHRHLCLCGPGAVYGRPERAVEPGHLHHYPADGLRLCHRAADTSATAPPSFATRRRHAAAAREPDHDPTPVTPTDRSRPEPASSWGDPAHSQCASNTT
jgi:hypothetical protein